MRTDHTNRRINLWFIVLLCAAALLVFDWWQAAFGAEEMKKVAAGPGMLSEPGRKYLEAAYETAVKEIQSRLDQENLLFGFKFALVGSILALLFKTQDQEKSHLLITT